MVNWQGCYTFPLSPSLTADHEPYLGIKAIAGKTFTDGGMSPGMP